MIDVLLIAVGLCALVALLRYGGAVAKRGLGVRLMVVAAAFMIISVGFELIANIASIYGDAMLAEQIRRAGVYVGYAVGGICAIAGGLLIALRSLLMK